MSTTSQSSGVQQTPSPLTAELPNWVAPVRYLLTGFRWVEALFVLVVLAAISSAASPNFMESRNIANIANNAATLIPLALGMMLTMLIGGIDLSVAGVAALTSVVAFNQISGGQPAGGTVVFTALALGFLIGLINGTLTVVFRVPAFAITFGMAALVRGLALSITGGRTIVVNDNSLDFLGGGGGSVSPAFWICVALVLIVWVVLLIIWLLRTRTGLGAFIIRGWQKRLSVEGIVVNLGAILTFALSGLLAALGGLMLTARLRAVTPIAATGQEIPILAGVIIGSVSLIGGMGNSISLLVGILAVAAVSNSMTLQNVPAANTSWILALLLLVAAAFNTPLNLVERWLKQRMWIARQMQATGK